jgi:tetratricopeptide (TPR) repeat protein
MRYSLIMPFVLLAALPAQAQVVTSYGNKLAFDCYRQALTGTDLAKGLETCNLALRSEPLSRNDRAATFDNRGVVLDKLERSDEAEADFIRAIQLRPDLGDAYVNRGAILIKRKQYDDALVETERGMALGSSFPFVAEYNRAVALQLLGRYREAYDGYRKVLLLQPGFAQAVEQLKNFTVTRQPGPTAN